MHFWEPAKCILAGTSDNALPKASSGPFGTCYRGYCTFVWLLDTVVTAHSSQSLCEVFPDDQNAFSGQLQMHSGARYRAVTVHSSSCTFRGSVPNARAALKP